MKKKILKVIKGILIFILAAVLALCLVMDLEPKLFDRIDDDYTETDMTWMSGVDDDTLLSQMSIPGAHDAGTDNGFMPLFLKCQDSDTASLLRMGCRYLDIRVGDDEEDGEEVLNIYHGFLKCLAGETPFAGTLGLDDMLEDCYEFLEENPSETILFVVKYEHGDMATTDMERLLKQYTDANPDMWLLTDTMPTLGEARGKVVLFRRYDDAAELGSEAGIPLLWDDQGGNDDVSLNLAENDNEGQTLYVQDRYKYGNDDKWAAFEEACKKTGDCLAEGATVINFLSTNGTAAYGHPHAHARALNRTFKATDADELLGGDDIQYGWVVIDFVDSEISRMVYERNED